MYLPHATNSICSVKVLCIVPFYLVSNVNSCSTFLMWWSVNCCDSTTRRVRVKSVEPVDAASVVSSKSRYCRLYATYLIQSCSVSYSIWLFYNLFVPFKANFNALVYFSSTHGSNSCSFYGKFMITCNLKDMSLLTCLLPNTAGTLKTCIQ